LRDQWLTGHTARQGARAGCPRTREESHADHADTVDAGWRLQRAAQHNGG
jgi:hypothetical protein